MKFVQNILFVVGAILMMGGAQVMAELMSGGVPNPTESSLRMWVRADSGTKNSGGTDAAVGEAVATWLDSSYAGTDFTAYSSPTLQNATINGATVKVVEFNGTSDYFSAGDVEMHNNATGMTIFAVANITYLPGGGGVVDGDHIVSKYVSAPTAQRQWSLGADKSNPGMADFNVQENAGGHSWDTHAGFALSASQWHIINGVWSPGDKPQVFLDGGLAGTATSAVNDIDNGVGRLVLGGMDVDGTAATLFLEGFIAEVLIYDRALSDTEKNEIGYYLGTKYNLDTSYIPEPSTLVMLATGLIGLLCYAWRKRK